MSSDLHHPWVREQYLNEHVRKLEAENAELREHLADVDRALGSNSGNRIDVIEQLSASEGQQRARAEKAERERDDARERAGRLDGIANEALKETADLRARLARYETPGPALLYVECGDHDVVCESDVDTPCVCSVGVAYREQHARCIAVISALKATHNDACVAYDAAAGRRRCRAHGCDGDVIEYGFELALAALIGEEP